MPNLVRGMTWFQTSYTVRYNARHRLSGHLFAGRYKALLVGESGAGGAGKWRRARKVGDEMVGAASEHGARVVLRDRGFSGLAAGKAGVALGQRSEREHNYHGAEIHDHGVREARRIIAQRLVEAGFQSLDLERLAKGDPRKVEIAKEVRTKTSVPLSFVARELSMGTPMYVSKLTNRDDQRPRISS